MSWARRKGVRFRFPMAIPRLLVLPLAIATVVVCLASSRVEARPGGGQGYSGRSSGRSSGSSSGSSSGGSSYGSSSSGSGGSSGPAISISGDDPLVWIGLALSVAVAVGFVFFRGLADASRRKKYGDTGNWDSRAALAARAPRPEPRRDGPQWRTPKNAFALVRESDPEFSAVLFDDFVYGLYATAHLASHDRDALALLAPYVSPAVRESLQARITAGRRVQSVVVGAMRVLGARANPPDPERRVHEVKIEIESNVTTVAGTQPPTADYLKEVWILSRRAQAHTRPWKGARTFGCPACGAPVTQAGDGRCAACGQVMENGRFDWQVASAQVLEAEPRPPALTGEVEERGTDLPTAQSPSLSVDWEALAAADPAVTNQTIAERLSEIFASLHAAWAAQDLRTVRPFVSDALLQYLQYWIDAYRSQGLRNAVEKARITKLEMAKVTRDLHYDAVTLRVFATGFEVTTNASTGEVVGGSRRRERPYSEYWTLIRGAEVRGRPPRAQACPGCGAALAINMAGSCAYCGAHVTAGEFDWVLSRIEQDDSYSG
jgi:predicted lipid-binding transport protein (Tim44 family)